MLAFTLEFDAFNQAIWILGSLKKFHALYDLLINHLFICETKALKLDLTILLVHGEPNEQQQIMTISGHIAQRALKTKQLLIFEILMLYRWNSMLQATSKLNRLEYLNS